MSEEMSQYKGVTVTSKADRVLENLRMYYSNIANKLEDYAVDGVTLTGTLIDGKKIFYNYITNNVRYLPQDIDTMTDEEYRNEFGYRVRNVMFKKGVNQVELANRTGISQPMLSGYLTGRNMPSYQNAAKIARALDCSLDEFVYRG